MVAPMMSSNPDVIPFPQRHSQPTATQTTPQAAPAVPVLILSADTVSAQQLEADAQAAGYTSRHVPTVEAAVAALQQYPSEVCLIGPLDAGDTAGLLAGQINQRGWSTQLICVLPAPTEDVPNLLPSAIGIELLPRPYTVAYLSLLLNSATQRSRLLSDNRRLKKQLINRNLREMVGQSQAMQTLRHQVQQAAEQNDGVLLCGESGTGGELVAQAIHDSSRRAHRPFVKADCSVLSAEALEQELFGVIDPRVNGGHRQPGRLEQADGGTIFFENIEMMALPFQKRLAQVLTQQRFEHPTTGERIRIDVRAVFATHANLDDLLAKGLFRPELHAEMHISCQLPTLRSRREDIAALAEHFLRRVAVREGRPTRSITIDALQILQAYEWPGNARELENLIERACSLDWGQKLTAAMVEPWLHKTEELDDDAPGGLTLAEMERKLIEATFVRFNGNREKTAKALQIGIRTLSGKLREYGYPPRGGPGSNRVVLKPVHAGEIDDQEPTISFEQERKAA